LAAIHARDSSGLIAVDAIVAEIVIAEAGEDLTAGAAAIADEDGLNGVAGVEAPIAGTRADTRHKDGHN